MRLLIMISCAALLVTGTVASGTDASQLDDLATADTMVRITFDKTPLSKVFQALAESTGTEISLELVQDTVVSVDIGRMTLKQALVRLGENHNLVYEVKSAQELIVKNADESKEAS